MTHEVIKHLLDDYVTGDLTEDARAPVAEHIAACDLCRSEIESLQAVVASARELPRSIEPPAEAWTGIRSAIARDENAVRTPGSTARFGERRRLYLAAAAVVLAAVLSSAGTAWYLSARNPAGNLSAAMAGNTSSETPATLAAFTIEENNYLRTASRLQDLLDQQEGSLAPETVAQLRASLHAIDDAIIEARNALARDPANKLLVEMLSSSYRQKVDLLRRSTELTRGT
jgi:anti-sigma factor ChrR (cupin superfamily)